MCSSNFVGDFAKGLDSDPGMYGQGGNFNQHYRLAAVTGGFPQQSLPPPPPLQQAGVTGGFPQQSLPPPPPLAQYPQPPAMQPSPGLYQHGVPPLQNQAYPYAQLSQMHQMPMLPQQRGFSQMPMPGRPPPPQAMYQAPQYPMPGSLPPPPPRPPSSAPKDALPPSVPPPPPPPPPPPSPPPVPPAPPTAPTTVHSCSAAPEGNKGAPDGGRYVKIGEAQLIVSDDSDMDMDGDEDSPSRVHLSPVNSSLATSECNRDVNVAKSVNDVFSSLGNDLPPSSDGKAKNANVTVEDGNPFQLIQGYASDDSEDEEHAGAASNLVLLPEALCSERNNEARKHQLKDESNPVKHNSDELGHLVKEDLSDGKSDVMQQSKMHGRSERKRSRNQSPQGRRSCSPSGGNKHSPSQSSSPGRQSRSPLAKRANLHQSKSPHKESRTCEGQPGVDLGISTDGFYNDKHDTPAKIAEPVKIHTAGGGNISGDRIAEQEGLMGTKKLNSSSDDLRGNEEENVAPGGTLGQHGHGEILISGSSQSMAASVNASDPHKTQRPSSPSQSQSDLYKSSPAADQNLLSQSSSGIPFASVHATKNSMACDVPGQMSSGFAPAHQSSSNMSLLPGQPLPVSSEFPQTQFQHNAMAPANEFLQNQMSMHPAQDLSHPRPLDFNPHTLQPVVASHQQPAAFHTDECNRPFPLDSAPVPLSDRQSEFFGGVGLPYSCNQSKYIQQQPPGSLASGANMVYPSFQRFPSNLPGCNDFGPIPDAGLPKSSIKPHYNPFASTFEQTDPSLNIGPGVSPNAVGSASTKAAEHMNTLSPFGQSVPGSRTRALESSAEAVPNRPKQSCPGFTFSAPYDPLLDSIEPSSNSINKMDLGQEANLSANDSRNASKLVNIEVESKNMHGLGLVAESEVEELGEVAADTEAGVVENVSPEPLGANDWSSDIPGDIDNDQSLDKSKKSKDSRSMKLFKIAIADFVKEVLKPSWRQGNMSREAFKTVVKKTVDKVSSSVPSNHIPKTPAKIKQYVQSSQRKVTKLVMGYVDKYVKLQLDQ